MTDWGDSGHHQYLPISYPGFALGACQSWNHRGSRAIDLDDLVNQIYFNEPDAIAARLLSRMGKVLELARSPIRNATVFNHLLFWHLNHESRDTISVTNANLEDCIAELNDIKSALPLISAHNRQLITDEFANAIDMALQGIQRLMYFRQSKPETKHVKGGNRRATHHRRNTAAQLRTDLLMIIGQHEKLWLLRNRPGGLNESTGYLKRSLASLQ